MLSCPLQTMNPLCTSKGTEFTTPSSVITRVLPNPMIPSPSSQCSYPSETSSVHNFLPKFQLFFLNTTKRLSEFGKAGYWNDASLRAATATLSHRRSKILTNRSSKSQTSLQKHGIARKLGSTGRKVHLQITNCDAELQQKFGRAVANVDAKDGLHQQWLARRSTNARNASRRRELAPKSATNERFSGRCDWMNVGLRSSSLVLWMHGKVKGNIFDFMGSFGQQRNMQTDQGGRIHKKSVVKVGFSFRSREKEKRRWVFLFVREKKEKEDGFFFSTMVFYWVWFFLQTWHGIRGWWVFLLWLWKLYTIGGVRNFVLMGQLPVDVKKDLPVNVLVHFWWTLGALQGFV